MKAKDKIINWLAFGETGMSSRNMAVAAVGGVPDSSYPHDPADLLRCLGLYKAAPEIRLAFPQIAKINCYWNALIENWDEAIELLEEEVALKKGVAPKTYAFMKKIYKEALDERKS